MVGDIERNQQAGSPVAANHKEQVMKTSLIALAFAATGTLVISTASAQQVQHGSISKIDEPSGTITIQQTPDGTVGTSNAASSDFKVQDGLLFNALRAGDKVTFTVDDINGAKTITKLQQD
jgi:Cu/Ag efflux protein CusF